MKDVGRLGRIVAASPRLRSVSSRLLSTLSAFGVDPVSMSRSIRGLAGFAGDAARFRALSRAAAIRTPIDFLHPMLSDSGAGAGVARGHYFHQDLWAARRIFARRPEQHLDVGSRVDGFIAHLLVFMPVSVVDVRPLATDVTGLQFVQGDATALDAWADNSVASLSSLHAVEHFGLGRYGDPIDPHGAFRAMAALARVLAPGGRLYFSVPIGTERIQFNAQRIFSPETILKIFAGHGLRLSAMAAVDDHGLLIPSADPEALAQARSSCGLFEFTK